MKNYAWPGNVRELENVIELTVINTQDDTLQLEDYLYDHKADDLKSSDLDIKSLESMVGPGENPIVAKFYDLYRDTRMENSVSTEVGAWGGAEFARIIQLHKMRKKEA